jgi:hypothetical protein
MKFHASRWSQKVAEVPLRQWFMRCYVLLCEALLVPLAGIEPALLAELDFESSASTNSATGAFPTFAFRRGREAGGI